MSSPWGTNWETTWTKHMEKKIQRRETLKITYKNLRTSGGDTLLFSLFSATEEVGVEFARPA